MRGEDEGRRGGAGEEGRGGGEGEEEGKRETREASDASFPDHLIGCR